MKTMKKALAILLTVLMVLSMAVSASADPTYTITLTDKSGNHDYKAYQIFAGDLNAAGTTLSNIVWGNGVNTTVLVGGLTLVQALAALEINGSTPFSSVGSLAEDKQAAAVAEILANNTTFPDSDKTNIDKVAAVFAKYKNVGHDFTKPATPVTGGTNTYTCSGLEDGYYLIVDVTTTLGEEDAVAKYMLSVVKNVNITSKMDYPTIEKKILKAEDSAEKGDYSTGNVGDKVYYEITADIPNMDGYKAYTFVVTDTLSTGLTFNDSSLKITVKGTEIDTTVSDNVYYVLSQEPVTGGHKITITFNNFIEAGTAQENGVVIKYSANINENAVVGNEGNPNTVNLKYSNDPNSTSAGNGGPTGTTPDDKVVTFVTDFELYKYENIDGLKTNMSGATFSIVGDDIKQYVYEEAEVFEVNASGTYYKLTDGTYTTVVPTANTTAYYDSTTEKYTKTTSVKYTTKTYNVNTTGTSDEYGVVKFTDLKMGVGTYTITETVTPDGYTTALPITLNVDFVPAANGTDKGMWIYTATQDGKVIWVGEKGATGVMKIDVENKKGSTLPETGGIGTTIFYIIGGAMMFVAVVLLVTKKKVGSKK